MPTPIIYSYPVRRPGFITGANWIGNPGDADLQLAVQYTDALGLSSVKNLYTLGNPNATLCLPSGKTVADISDDVYTAHIRMAGMISGFIPGSTEYADALIDSGLLDARNFQMPIGDVKVTSIVLVSDAELDVTFQKSSGGSTKTVRMGIQDLATYAFAPSTQLVVLAGAVKKEYPTYQQDATQGKYLTQAQMNTIASFVVSQQPWV